MSLPANQYKLKFAWLLSEKCLPNHVSNDDKMSSPANTFSGCSVKSAWQTRHQILQKYLLANGDYNLPGCSVKTALTCQPLQILLWLYCEKNLAERIISCISEHILYIYLTAGKKCLADRVIHDLITRKMWLLKNDIFENPISIRTNTPNQ